MLAQVHSRGVVAVEAPRVEVEVHVANGLPGLSIVGLPETAVKESKDRVRGALQNCLFEFPAKRITINLAPADLPKDGGRFDLPVALGLLVASGQLPSDCLHNVEFIGELALSGELRPVHGVLPTAMAAARAGRALVVPRANADEAALVSGLTVLAAGHLLDICAHLSGQDPLPRHVYAGDQAEAGGEDLVDVRGQFQARRALEIAAAGGHSLLMLGPPGTGKTMLASRLPGILPAMSEAEALETAAVRSVSQLPFQGAAWRRRPFRSPHHTASAVALVGGGPQPRPGEISLAHNGVLFLDELPEFDRKVLEVLREPLESGRIHISRAARQAEFPASFQLVAAMNPCPCGYLGDGSGRCHCTQEQVSRYRGRISGPLLDRIDIQLEVGRIGAAALHGENGPMPESSATVRARVVDARQCQLQRAGKANARLTSAEVFRHCVLKQHDQRMLEQAMERLHLSLRAYQRILKVARTIADLAQAEFIATAHLLEAMGYRCLDRQPTGDVAGA